jgi:uncharacterized membrane protein SpoIIM required for sporulation
VKPKSEELYTHWLEQRLDHWQHLRLLMRGSRRNRNLQQAREVMEGYRSLASDLALARRHAPNTTVHQALEALYADAHKSLRRTPFRPLLELWELYSMRVPQAVRALKGDISVVAVLFVLTAVAGFLLVWTWPETGAWFLSEDMMLNVQNRSLWTDNLLNVVPSSLLSYQLMTNNITVALTAFALGWIFGIGTLYIITLNGLMLGSVFGYTAKFDMALPLFKFVIAHGLVELSVICLAGAAGLSLGRALARPGALGRGESVRVAARNAGALAAICIPFLIGSGLIEGYVSPNDSYALTSRVFIGLLWFLVLLAVMHGRLLSGLSYIWWRARNVL